MLSAGASARTQMENMEMSKLAYTIAEAVEAGAGGRTKIYEAIKTGELKARKRGKRTIILAPDLLHYLESLPDFPNQAAAA